MKLVRIVKRAGKEFSEDYATMLAAATAFYAALSLAPIIMLLIWTAGLLGQGTQEQLIDQITTTVGQQSGEAIRLIIRNASGRPDVATFAGLISIAALIFSATTLFAQLQSAMNIIWDVRPKPGSGVGGWIRKRLITLGVMLLMAVLLLASVIASSALSGLAQSARGTVAGGDWTWWWVNLAASIIVYGLLFAVAFKILPDVQIGWRATWFGAFLTAVLFAVGKMLLGLYIANSARWAAYGAAGSIIVLLVWVYYSAIIFFFGAELTQVWARMQGEAIAPAEHAEWAEAKPATAG